MKNSTLLMFGIVAAVAMLSAAVVLPIQQASAGGGDTVFKFTQKAKSKADDGSTAFNIQSICQNFFSGGGSCRLQ